MKFCLFGVALNVLQGCVYIVARGVFRGGGEVANLGKW